MPEFYVNHGPGAVVSFTIDKYIYVSVNPRFEDGIRVSYSITEDVPTPDLLKHDIVRETLKMTGMTNHVEVTSVADIPGKGSGLGSSSAFAVGLLMAIQPARGHALAEGAYLIERTLCKKPVGKQDHFASAIGGMNLIRFMEWGQVSHSPITGIPPHKIEEKCLLLYTGITRKSKDILHSQGVNLATNPDAIASAQRMAMMALDLYNDLQNGNDNIGEFLHKNWELKKKLTGKVSTPDLDLIYRSARAVGAEGGKLCGAGGGGFFLFYADPAKHADIIEATGLRHVPFKIDTEGSKVIYADDTD